MSSFHRLLSHDFKTNAAKGIKSTMVEISDRIPEAVSSSSDDFGSPSSSLSPRTDAETKQSASVSSFSPSPVNDRTSSLSSLKENLMTKSTIYRRHEARLARSYELRDDPRPAFLRVLSGLPGFRMIIPPYRSESKKNLDKPDEEKQEIPATKVAPGAYSEETLFARYSNAADNAVGPTFAGINDDANDYTTTLEEERIMQAMLATGFCSGTAEYVFAYCNNNRTRRLESATSSSSSPFRNSNTTGSTTTKPTTTSQHSPLFFHHKSSAASNIFRSEIFKGNTREMPNVINNNALLKTANKARPSTGAFSTALSAAFPTSLLFGMKIFLDSALENQQNETELNHHNNNSRRVANTILSSAIAGGVVGSSRLALLQVKHRQLQSQSSSLSIIHQQSLTSGYPFSLMGRNIMAAILYFSIYDGVSSISSTSKVSPIDHDTSALLSTTSTVRSDSSGSERKGTLTIVAGGALAGVAHTAAMNCHRYGHYGSMIWWSRIMLPATTRAAPIHAFVFYGYEKMKESMKTAP
jgi:hypothetical protein